MRRQSSIIDHRSSIPKGYTLIEMLAVIAVAPMLMVLFGSFLVTFLRDIPQGTRLMDESTAVLRLLDQLRQDMDWASALPSQSGDKHVDDATLLIRQAEGLVCYRLEEGRIVRTAVDSQGNATQDGETVWQAPDAVIQWQLWTRDGEAYAVEVRSHLRQRVAGEIRHRFRNSHVFFVGGLIPGGEIQ